MKKLLLILSIIITAGCSQAQTPALNTPIPTYKLLTTDSTYVSQANLKKNVPVMLIYFQPDCPHCEHLMQGLKPQLASLKNVQIVLATFVLKLKPIKDFQQKFGLNKYHNITLGTEGYTYVLQRYFNIATTPYIAIYNKSGKLTKTYDKVPKVEDLLSSLKKVE